MNNITNQLNEVAADLQGIQRVIPQTDTDSVDKLNQAYALIEAVAAVYQTGE